MFIYIYIYIYIYIFLSLKEKRENSNNVHGVSGDQWAGMELGFCLNTLLALRQEGRGKKKAMRKNGKIPKKKTLTD
jgi:hypothetical protein